MITSRIRSLLYFGSLLLATFPQPTHAENPTVDFNRDIRPILAKNCFACHGPDKESREADLRLDTAKGATEEHDGRRAIVPGKPDSSELIARIESFDPDQAMPPLASGGELTEADKKLLRDWIASGAEYKVHWSFVVPKKAPLPKVRQKDWPAHPLDHFVLAKLELAGPNGTRVADRREPTALAAGNSPSPSDESPRPAPAAQKTGLSPTEAADRYHLIRRLSLDLTGLPPTPEEADAFVADKSKDAYEKVVDRLLKSEAYGEHWARMWLDLARYADTKGYEKDRHRDIWRYRDWVIDALNRDLSFDQFTIQQLAGDLLPNATSDQILATAFHRNTMTNDEGGTDNEEFRTAAVKDRVDTTMQVWMGLTMGCAKCHSHKYDPISQTDYYSFYAFFNQTEDADRGDDAPLAVTPTAEQKKKIAELEAAVKSLQEKAKGEDASKEDGEKLKATQKALADARKAIPKTPVMKELAKNRRRKTTIHQRGNFLDPGEAVEEAVPQVFGSLPKDAPKNRLGVARWLVQKDNPLTSRVMVNRVWARLFGTGIVETEEDFGTQGLPPSHPELLDWLAVDFRENGWSLKKLLRTIVLSSTYRQSTKVDETRLELDPQNRLLSRGARFRLSAEVVRDQALFVSGLLTEQLGGPSVMPPQPGGVWKSTYNTQKWKNAVGPQRYRRGLYTYWKRTSPYPSMLTFDASSREVCQIRRIRTNTPLQALVLLNDPAFVEAAGALAARMEEASDELNRKVAHGFRLTLIRPPTVEERRVLVELYRSLTDDYSHDKEASATLVKAAGNRSKDAAMIAVANVLLNLDETLMKP